MQLLIRAETLLEKSEVNYKNEKYFESFGFILDCFSIIPSKKEASQTDFTSKMRLERKSILAFANELLGNLYEINSNYSFFKMKNASNILQMRNHALNCWRNTLNICEKLLNEKQLQVLRLKVVPKYLLLAQKLNVISQNETINKIYELINVSKILYDDTSIEKSQCMQHIIDLIAMYCPENNSLLEELSTSVMYYCQKYYKELNTKGKNNNLETKTKMNESYELMTRSRTRLLQFWETQNWIGVLKICNKIAITQINSQLNKDLRIFCSKDFNECPKIELKKYLIYFENTLNKQENQIQTFYVNSIIIYKLIKNNLFIESSKLLLKLNDIIFVDQMEVHFRCLMRHFKLKCKNCDFVQNYSTKHKWNVNSPILKF